MRGTRVGSGGVGAALVGTMLEALVACAAAQSVARPDTALPPGRLQGSVIAAQTSAPIEGAAVSIGPAGGGVMAAGRRSPFWDITRTTRTDASGVYRFHDLAPGRYQLHIQRIGYQSTDVEVDLRDASGLRLSVGLSMLPIALEPVTVRAIAADAGPSSFRGGWEEVARSRMNAEAERRRRFLATDTRALTTADLTEAVTLGETDLFRALQRVAGVTTRDEFTAELWTRGGRWSDTRVTYDGLPLFSPLHAGGTIAGVPPDAVGSAVFHPGVRPASSGEGAAATLELASRPAGDPGVHGAAELSTVSARTTLASGGTGVGPRWVLGARRSYIDLASRLVAGFQQDSTIPIRYAFMDLSGRLDIPLGTAAALEMSGLRSSDVLAGTVPDFLGSSRGRWGNSLLRATLVAPLGALVSRHTVGVSRYAFDVDECHAPSCPSVSNTTYRINSHTDFRYVGLASRLGPRSGDAWSSGYELALQRLDHDGWGPISNPHGGGGGFFRFQGATDVLSLWGEKRSRLGKRVTVQTGLRVETGSKIAGASRVRVAPRLQARYALSGDDLLLSVGVGRSFQYSQAVGSLGPGMGPELHLSDVWILADDTIPAIRSDLASAGLEYWMTSGWVAAFQVYSRGQRGLGVPDPTPGTRSGGASDRLFVIGSSTTGGAELSLRKLAGRWTGSASLTLSHSTITAQGYRYRAPTNRGAVLHATGLIGLRPNFRLGGAITVAGSAPFTRYVMFSACDEAAGPACPPTANNTPLPYVEASSGARAPAIAALDVLADWTRDHKTWTLGAYLQLRNVIRATRAVTYTGSVNRCASPPGADWVLARPGMCDRYARGLPLLPLAGVRVSF